MSIDARTLPAGSEIEADVCIVGGGPAGITVARELLGKDLRLCLVESGGRGFDAAADGLNEFEVGDGELVPTGRTRRRQLGGTSHEWDLASGRAERLLTYLRMDPIDLRPRAWVPDSGWPLTPDDLEPYYRRALTVCGVPDYSADLDAHVSEEAPALPLDPHRMRTSVDAFGPAELFSDVYPAALATSSQCRVLLHATVDSFEERPSADAVETAVVRSTDGARTHRVRARVFVLAAGGIENARVLLLSNGRQAAGLGNQHDNVGRWHMGHPRVHAGVLTPTPATYDRLGLYDLLSGEGGFRLARLNLTDEAMADEGVLNSATALAPRRRPRSVRLRLVARHLRDSARRRRLDPSVLRELARLPGTTGSMLLEAAATVGRTPFPPDFERGWSRFRGKRWVFDGFDLVMQMELSPSRENRVTLGSERDALGRPRARLDVRWTELSRRTAARVPQVLARAFADAGIGDVRTPPEGELRIWGDTGHDTHHQMGATRMSVSPAGGVVDPDCRVHGLENLFVAGSSVFPVGGYANPTLTIVALSLRLADHIERALGSSHSRPDSS